MEWQAKKDGFYTFTRSYFGVKVYLCRKIVRIMDKKRFIVLFVLLPALFGAVVSMILIKLLQQ